MANLLPQYKKKEVRKEYKERAIILFLLMSGGIFLTLTILLGSLYILLGSRMSELERLKQADIIKQEEVVKLKESISDIRVKLELLQKDVQTVKLPYGLFRAVVDIKPEYVSLERITYSNNNQIVIGGVASRRKDLEDFVIAIGEHELFLPIEYPFSNITQKEDIAFSLNITLKTFNEN